MSGLCSMQRALQLAPSCLRHPLIAHTAAAVHPVAPVALRSKPLRASRAAVQPVGFHEEEAAAQQQQQQAAASAAPTAPAPAAAAPAAVSSSSWPCKSGHLVRITQEQLTDGQHQLHITLTSSSSSSKAQGGIPELHWGVYRSAPHKWQHPPEVVPPGSELDARSGAMRSAMHRADEGQHSMTLTLPATLAPLTLSFVVYTPPSAPSSTAPAKPSKGQYITPLQGRHFSALVGMQSGAATPLGATLVGTAAAAAAAAAAPKRRGCPSSGGAAAPATGDAQPAAAQQQQHTVNFAVRCRGAERVALVLLKPPSAGAAQQKWGTMEVVLDPVLNRTGDTYHIALSGLKGLEGLCYGWRLEGDVSWDSGNRISPDQLLLDPWNQHLMYLPAAEAAGESGSASAPPPPPLPLPTIVLADGRQAAALSSLAGLVQQQRAQAEGQVPEGRVARPGRALEDMRVLEADVRTFATGKGVTHPGTYLGMLERVEHIKAVGANTLVLTPSYATAQGSGLMGRATVSLLAPDPTLSSDPASATAAENELKEMVDGLHAQRIEVLMQVDLTFTAEGTDQAPHTLGLRGLDHASYFRPNGVLNCGHAATREYIMQALRHWALEYNVDGFCFINAENLVQDRSGLVLDAPPLPEALCHDPLLSGLKLVALSSDDSLLPRSGARGFPHWGLWQQRNTAFGRDMVAFLAEGTPGLLTAVAQRLTGSADIFEPNWEEGLPGNLAAGRRPAFGLNTLTVLGRQAMVELAAEAAEVAGAAAAAEQGHPGGTAAAASADTICKSLLAAAILSPGVPVIPQDAVVGLETAVFVGVMLRLRARLAPLLLPARFDSPRDIRWYAATAGQEPQWDAAAAMEAATTGSRDYNYMAFAVRNEGGQAVYVGLNAHPHAVTATLPLLPAGHHWLRVVDTSLEATEDALLQGGEPLGGPTYSVAAKAVVVMVAAVVETVDAAPALPA